MDRILSWQYHADLFDVHTGEQSGHVVLQFSTNTTAGARLHRRLFGRNILFTDNHDWSNAEIIAAYRGQYGIEDAFKQMKYPAFDSWTPRYHWTDQKIHVNALYCILALTIVSLLQRELSLGACRELAPSKQESTTYEP